MDASLTIAADRAAASNRWSPARRQAALREYQRFVRLVRDNPGVPLVPAVDIDLIWHEHLGLPLSTGTGPPAPPRHAAHRTTDQDGRFASTIALYRDRFGEPGAA